LAVRSGCQYKLKKHSKSKKDCRTCQRKGDIIGSGADHGISGEPDAIGTVCGRLKVEIERRRGHFFVQVLDIAGFLLYYRSSTIVLKHNGGLNGCRIRRKSEMTWTGATISIDTRSGVPFYRQIINQVLLNIATGRLRPGERLRTVRQLAIDLQVNPNTVSRAYRELEIREVVTTQRGTGTFVAADPGVAKDAAKRREFLEEFCNEFTAEAGKLGFSLAELVEALRDRLCERR